jgi:hypothetical protein
MGIIRLNTEGLHLVNTPDRRTHDESEATMRFIVASVPENASDFIEKLETVFGNPDDLIVGCGVNGPEDRRLLFGPDGNEKISHPRFKIEIFDDGVRFATDGVTLKLTYEDCRKLRIWKSSTRIGR